MILYKKKIKHMEDNTVMIVISKKELKNAIESAVASGFEKEKQFIKSIKVEKEELLTTQQTLEFLKIDRSTLKRWVDKGKIRKYSICGKKYYKYAEILENLKCENI